MNDVPRISTDDFRGVFVDQHCQGSRTLDVTSPDCVKIPETRLADGSAKDRSPLHHPVKGVLQSSAESDVGTGLGEASAEGLGLNKFWMA
jgi:hypothetical protein